MEQCCCWLANQTNDLAKNVHVTPPRKRASCFVAASWLVDVPLERVCSVEE